MRLYPWDLGDQWHVLFVRRRTRRRARLPLRSLLTTTEPAGRIGPLGRLWTRGRPVSRAVAAQTLPDAIHETRGPVIAGAALAAVLALVGFSSSGNGVEGVLLAAAFSLGAFWTAAVLVPRRRLRRLHEQPLTGAETDALLREAARPLRPTGSVFVALAGELRRTLMTRDEAATRTPPPFGDLEIAFLTLVRDMLARPNSQNAVAERDLRDTLRALGEAVVGLPHVAASSAETIVLRQNATAISARARDEKDPIVAASLLRQADALKRQAEAADETNVLARRTAYLRQELLAQTHALRTSLAATAAARPGDTLTANPSALADLAQAVEAIVGEAQALSRARRELDEINEPDWTDPGRVSAAPPAEVRLRQRR